MNYRIIEEHKIDRALFRGFVYGAMQSNVLKGFVTVDAKALGPDNEYLDLRDLFVSADARGQGIGRELFRAAAQWARSKGACKLYLSAHSAIETQAFSKAMGCVDANTSACGTSKKNRTTANSNTPLSPDCNADVPALNRPHDWSRPHDSKMTEQTKRRPRSLSA
ncbi:MAG: GNAT family N-acetyltransferase [Slackia sp.]